MELPGSTSTGSFVQGRVMNSVENPHANASVSASSVLSRSPVFRISKPFLSKFITASRMLVNKDANKDASCYDPRPRDSVTLGEVPLSNLRHARSTPVDTPGASGES
jgi:hypothetical protein